MAWEADFKLDLHDLFHSSAIGGPFQLASYGNPALDEVLDRASAVADRTSSLPLWHQVQRILRDDQPWTFLYYFPDLILASEDVAGMELDLRGVFASASRWRLDRLRRFAR
jgi:peptide/nickel transport system substrate-binding protein